MQTFFYQEWTGRYTATFLQAGISRWDLSWVYGWVSATTLLATLLAFRTLVGALLPGGTPRLHLAAAGAVATAVFVGRLPSPIEAFFWMASSTTYQWGLIAYIVWSRFSSGVAKRKTCLGGGGPCASALSP